MRALLRIISALLAAAFFAAGLLVIMEIIAAATDSGPALVQWPRLVNVLARNSWNDVGPKVAGGVLVGVGFLLLLLGLRRGKPTALPLTHSVHGIEVRTTRRSIQRALANEALLV